MQRQESQSSSQLSKGGKAIDADPVLSEMCLIAIGGVRWATSALRDRGQEMAKSGGGRLKSEVM
jgi:hypothetical protein